MHDTPPTAPEFPCDPHDVTSARDSAQALPDAAAIEPTQAIAMYLHQGEILVRVSQRDRADLLAAGCDPHSLDQLAGRMAWLRDSDAQWQVRRAGKGDALRQREKAAVDLRDETLADLRWWLRKDAEAQGKLDAIAEGEGLPDALHDLDDLVVLLGDHAATWPAASPIDPHTRATQCQQAAAAAREGVAVWKADETSEQLKRARDKAFAWADAAVREVRAAGRYAYRKQPAKLVDYRDGYKNSQQRSQRRERAARATTEPTPA